MDNTLKKLTDSIPTTSIKIIELYSKIDNNLLNLKPTYQRKLVWKKQHKYAFIETILLNYPFPEVYIASIDIDVENMIAAEVVVDGQQRLTTIVEYIKAKGDFEDQRKITPFDKLKLDEKKEFLNYKVSVKDLKNIEEDLIKEIFQRINSTEYSLNTVEKNNAQFGDGEIALFCKQLAENYEADVHLTDIIVSKPDRDYIYSFFVQNEIFTQNDIKRMYDFQYFMLIISTFLEGEYFGRSKKIDEYLEKYNSEFPQFQTVLDYFKNAINIIRSLNLPTKSYWYNKANLYSLIVELGKVEKNKLDLLGLERSLLILEDKVDIYFNADDVEDIEEISEDEKRYFEFARHGSHEKAAREHRGKVVAGLIKNSLIKNTGDGEDQQNNFEAINISALKENEINYSIIVPTKTGLSKGIIDAVSDVRTFLRENGIHNYSEQDLGPTHKIIKSSIFREQTGSTEHEMSLYRSNGRGDYRIWFKDLPEFADENDKLALIVEDGVVNLLNISKCDYSGEW